MDLVCSMKGIYECRCSCNDDISMLNWISPFLARFEPRGGILVRIARLGKVSGARNRYA